MKFHIGIVLLFLSISLQETSLCFDGESEEHEKQCLENPPKLNSSSGGGFVSTLGGLNSYINGPPHSSNGIVLISDIYGYEVPNLRKVADKVAAAGYYAVVPDFFNGDAYIVNVTNRTVAEWKQDHLPYKGVKDAIRVFDHLTRQGKSVFGVGGFCWGGQVALDLAKTNRIRASVLLHPSNITVDDFEHVKVPISILSGELDKALPSALLKEFEKVLSTRPEVNRRYNVNVFPGARHGFALRYQQNDTLAVKNADESHEDMLDWFIKYVK